MNNTDKPIWQMTAGEFIDLLREYLKTDNPPMTVPVKKEKRYLYGIAGIASIFDCSVATANRIKKSGVIDEAIIQNGRKIIVDADMAYELLSSKKKSRRRK